MNCIGCSKDISEEDIENNKFVKVIEFEIPCTMWFHSLKCLRMFTDEHITSEILEKL